LNTTWPSTGIIKASVPFGVTYEKIGTMQRRLASPLHNEQAITGRENVVRCLTISVASSYSASCFSQSTIRSSIPGDLLVPNNTNHRRGRTSELLANRSSSSSSTRLSAAR
ncbi:hypothetical protein BC835DRAFT_1301280, partial [Cytidiella melzeri]